MGVTILSTASSTSVISGGFSHAHFPGSSVKDWPGIGASKGSCASMLPFLTSCGLLIFVGFNNIFILPL